jgi:hypothetical protein
MAFEFSLKLFAALVEFIIGYLGTRVFFLLCFLPFVVFFLVGCFFFLARL